MPLAVGETAPHNMQSARTEHQKVFAQMMATAMSNSPYERASGLRQAAASPIQGRIRPHDSASTGMHKDGWYSPARRSDQTSEDNSVGHSSSGCTKETGSPFLPVASPQATPTPDATPADAFATAPSPAPLPEMSPYRALSSDDRRAEGRARRRCPRGGVDDDKADDRYERLVRELAVLSAQTPGAIAVNAHYHADLFPRPGAAPAAAVNPSRPATSVGVSSASPSTPSAAAHGRFASTASPAQLRSETDLCAVPAEAAAGASSCVSPAVPAVPSLPPLSPPEQQASPAEGAGEAALPPPAAAVAEVQAQTQTQAGGSQSTELWQQEYEARKEERKERKAKRQAKKELREQQAAEAAKAKEAEQHRRAAAEKEAAEAAAAAAAAAAETSVNSSRKASLPPPAQAQKANGAAPHLSPEELAAKERHVRALLHADEGVARAALAEHDPLELQYLAQLEALKDQKSAIRELERERAKEREESLAEEHRARVWEAVRETVWEEASVRRFLAEDEDEARHAVSERVRRRLAVLASGPATNPAALEAAERTRRPALRAEEAAGRSAVEAGCFEAHEGGRREAHTREERRAAALLAADAADGFARVAEGDAEQARRRRVEKEEAVERAMVASRVGEERVLVLDRVAWLVNCHEVDLRFAMERRWEEEWLVMTYDHPASYSVVAWTLTKMTERRAKEVADFVRGAAEVFLATEKEEDLEREATYELRAHDRAMIDRELMQEKRRAIQEAIAAAFTTTAELDRQAMPAGDAPPQRKAGSGKAGRKKDSSAVAKTKKR